MNTDALPYTLLILMAELSTGSLAWLLLWDFRRLVPGGFVKSTALILAALAALTYWVAVSVGAAADVDGYPLDADAMPAVRWATGIFAILTVPYLLAVFGQRHYSKALTGGVATAAGVAAIVLLGRLVSVPTWGLAAVLASLLVGSGVVGAVSLGMVLGHWYLVSPRLSERPLAELTRMLLVVLSLQLVVMAVNLALPVREEPTTSATADLPLGQNPFLWMRVGIGLLFAGVLSYMAWRSSRDHAMQSATGLLYLAMGAVFGGELVARGLMFVTAIPV